MGAVTGYGAGDGKASRKSSFGGNRPEVVAATKEYLRNQFGFSDPQVTIHHTDGIKFGAHCKDEYVIIINHPTIE